MTFEDYLTQKKIDSIQFKTAELENWDTLRKVFEEMHPKSFTSQKLFLINPIRRKYPLREKLENSNVQPKKVTKPVMKPATKAKPAMGRPKLK